MEVEASGNENTSEGIVIVLLSYFERAQIKRDKIIRREYSYYRYELVVRTFSVLWRDLKIPKIQILEYNFTAWKYSGIFEILKLPTPHGVGNVLKSDMVNCPYSDQRLISLSNVVNMLNMCKLQITNSLKTHMCYISKDFWNI